MFKVCTRMSDRHICSPLLNMQLIVQLFPQHNAVTVYRWRKNTKGKGRGRLPEPDLVVGGVDMWSVETIQGWADETDRVLDSAVLERICRTQLAE